MPDTYQIIPNSPDAPSWVGINDAGYHCHSKNGRPGYHKTEAAALACARKSQVGR